MRGWHHDPRPRKTMMKTLIRMRPQVLELSISLAFQLRRLAFRFSALVRFSFRTLLHDSYSVQYRYFRCGGVLNWRVHAEHFGSLHIGACQADMSCAVDSDRCPFWLKSIKPCRSCHAPDRELLPIDIRKIGSKRSTSTPT